MDNYKRFVSPENQSILQKTVKKYRRDRFLRKRMVPGDGIKFLWSPITSVLRAVDRNGFSRFYSSSKALSNDISLTLKLKIPFNRFGDVSLSFETSQFDILRQTKTCNHLVNNRSLSGKFGREMNRNVKDT